MKPTKLWDMHMHSQFSGDSDAPQEDMILTAMDAGVKADGDIQQAGTDGYFCIDRDCEGLPQFAEIQVTITQGD